MPKNPHVDMLLTLATMPDSSLTAELHEAQWAHFGRRVHENMTHDNMVVAINRAGLKSKNISDLAAMLRAYLLTGALP